MTARCGAADARRVAASAALWAFASTRYALASRAVGSARVNLTRASTVLPIFAVATLVTTRGHLFAGIDGTRAAWLGLSVLCAYGFADNVFFAAARRVGITTALAIASSYPLWAALVGAPGAASASACVRAGGTVLVRRRRHRAHRAVAASGRRARARALDASATRARASSWRC